MSKPAPKRICLLIVVSLLSGLLAGCWDQLEIEDRALVLGLSIDKATADEVKDEQATHIKNTINLPMIRVSAQIAVPGRVPLGPGSSEGGSGNINPVWVVKVYGFTLDDAMNNLQQQIADPRYLIHLRVIIVSKDIAREHLLDLNDYLRRNPEVRRQTWLLVSEGEASEFMNIQPPLQRVPTLYTLAMMEKAVESGRFPADYLGTFWSSESKWGESGYLPYVALRNKENVLIKGLAFFSSGVMTGHTTPIEIGAYMAMKGINPGGYSILFDSPEFGPVMIMVNKRLSSVKVSLKNGKPHVSYTVHLDTSLDEHLYSNVKISSSHALLLLENSFQKGVIKIFNHFIQETQKAHSDILGTGEYVRAHYPAYWRAKVHDKGDWEQMYSNITIDIHVDVAIRKVGLKVN